MPGYPVGWCIRANGSAPEEAEAAGFEFVELALQDVNELPDEDFDKLAARLQALAAAGLPAVAGYNFFPNELKLIGPEADQAKLDAHLAKGLPRLARLGLKYVVFNSGPARKAPDDMAPAAGPQAAGGVQPALRPGGPQAQADGAAAAAAKHRHQPGDHGGRGGGRRPGGGATQLPGCWPTGRSCTSRRTTPPELGKARGRLAHVWLAKPGPRTYPVSEDAAEYDALFAALAKIRYRGGLSVHARTDNFFADAPEALRFLRTRAAELAARK